MFKARLLQQNADARRILQGVNTPGMKDALCRALHMENVFQDAKRHMPHPNAENLPNTLCIFIAPEFYFRNSAEPYTHNEFYGLLDFFKIISQRYPRWMFLMGTVWWADMAKSNGAKVKVVHNSAVTLQNGVIINTYLKQLPSGIDGLRGEDFWDGNSHGGHDSLKCLQEYTALRKRMRSDKTDSCLFEHQNLKFGIEVCLDHSTGYLKAETRNKVDIHLTTCCSVGTVEENIMAKNGGCFLKCDGISRKARQSQAMKIGGGRCVDIPCVKRIENDKLRNIVSRSIGDDTVAVYELQIS